jgi:hypothetical protein
MLGPLRFAAENPASKPVTPIDHTHEMPAIERLARDGYTADFRAEDGELRVTGTGQRYTPEEASIRDYYRFEGTSNPDDMSVIYAVETRDGTRGTLIDAFGTYSDAAVGDIVDRMDVEPPEE